MTTTPTPSMPSMPPVSSNPRRRVVLEHRTDAMKGVFQILGPDDGAKPAPLLSIPVVGGGHAHFGLVKVTPRIVLYREVIAPEGLGRFHKDQQ